MAHRSHLHSHCRFCISISVVALLRTIPGPILALCWGGFRIFSVFQIGFAFSSLFVIQFGLVWDIPEVYPDVFTVFRSCWAGALARSFCIILGIQIVSKIVPKTSSKGIPNDIQNSCTFCTLKFPTSRRLGHPTYAGSAESLLSPSLLFSSWAPVRSPSGPYKPWSSGQERLKPSKNAPKVTPECDSGHQLRLMLGRGATVLRTQA